MIVHPLHTEEKEDWVYVPAELLYIASRSGYYNSWYKKIAEGKGKKAAWLELEDQLDKWGLDYRHPTYQAFTMGRYRFLKTDRKQLKQKKNPLRAV